MKHALEALRKELAAGGVAVALLVLFKLLSTNGTATVSPTLKLALGKMTLFCNASGVRPLGFGHRIASIPHAVFNLRWTIATALFSVGISVLAVYLGRQVSLHQPTPAAHAAPDKVQLAMER